MSRSYRQYCGLARALDVIGDRWNLLIVRQLLMGPARYRELSDGLPGIASNLLSDRLRDLETSGVVQRQLAPSGNAVAYALTDWGAELRDPIEGLIRWSTPLMVPGPQGDPFLPEWLAVALPALLNRPGKVTDGSATVGLQVEGQLFHTQLGAQGVEVVRHDGRPLDAILSAEPMIILGLAAGMLNLDEICEAIEIQGDDSVIRLLFEH